MMKRVLVCDDDEGISEVIKIMLEGAGYQVLLINNGRAIQKKIREYKPQLILLDVWMPGASGKEITVMLKKDREFAKIPVIIVSALNNTQKIAEKYGADGHLSKPFEMKELLSLVKKHIS